MRKIHLMATAFVLLIGISCSYSPSSDSVSANTQGQHSVLFARFVPERSDDFAWENDMIAARAYGPSLRVSSENAGTDCWLKRVTYPVVNKWYDQALNHNKSYHQDHGEGLDNYHVGASLGCGGSAVWLDGEAMPLETFVRWSDLNITDTKLSFVLHYEHELKGLSYQEQKKITLVPHVRLFRVNSIFTINGKLAPNLPVAIGLTTHESKAALHFDAKRGWVAAWENIQGDKLGTAVIAGEGFDVQQMVAPLSTNTNDQHGLLLTETNEQAQIEYYVGYGWAKAGHITTLDQWKAYLDNFADQSPY